MFLLETEVDAEYDCFYERIVSSLGNRCLRVVCVEELAESEEVVCGHIKSQIVDSRFLHPFLRECIAELDVLYSKVGRIFKPVCREGVLVESSVVGKTRIWRIRIRIGYHIISLHMDFLWISCHILECVAGCSLKVAVAFSYALEYKAEVDAFPSEISSHTVGVARNAAADYSSVILRHDSSVRFSVRAAQVLVFDVTRLIFVTHDDRDLREIVGVGLRIVDLEVFVSRRHGVMRPSAI